MATEDDRRAVLEGIAFGSDTDVSPADRLRALELLREMERGPNALAMKMAQEVLALTDDELDRELAGFMGQPVQPPPLDDAAIERRVQARIEQLIRAGELLRPPVDDDPGEPADAVDDAVPAPEPPTEPRPADSRGIPLPPGIDDPAALDAAWGETRAQRRERERFLRGGSP